MSFGKTKTAMGGGDVVVDWGGRLSAQESAPRLTGVNDDVDRSNSANQFKLLLLIVG